MRETTAPRVLWAVGGRNLPKSRHPINHSGVMGRGSLGSSEQKSSSQVDEHCAKDDNKKIGIDKKAILESAAGWTAFAAATALVLRYTPSLRLHTGTLPIEGGTRIVSATHAAWASPPEPCPHARWCWS